MRRALLYELVWPTRSRLRSPRRPLRPGVSGATSPQVHQAVLAAAGRWAYFTVYAAYVQEGATATLVSVLVLGATRGNLVLHTWAVLVLRDAPHVCGFTSMAFCRAQLICSAWLPWARLGKEALAMFELKRPWQTRKVHVLSLPPLARFVGCLTVWT